MIESFKDEKKIWLCVVDIAVVLVKLNAIIAPEELDFRMAVVLLAVGSGYHTCLRVADQELWKRRIQRNKIRNHLTDE